MRRRRIGFWYGLAITVLRPLIVTVTRKNWQGAENLPAEGGLVVVVNHISYADFLTFGHFMVDNGRLPRFLAKVEVFGIPFIGRVLAGAQQIPVYRETSDAAVSYAAAVDAVRRGECVAIYPEGTLTRDPDLWPMRGKTGAVRIALATGCPVIPVAQWGAQLLLAPGAHWPRLGHRIDSQVLAGPPVDLSAFEGLELTEELTREATEQLMSELTSLVGQLRHEPPPDRRWDPREHLDPPQDLP